MTRTRALPVVALAAACGSSPRPPEPRAAPARVAERTPESRPGSAPVAAVAPPSECGELALERLALVADGKGEAHPTRVAVERALAACSDPRPSSAACARVIQDRREQQRLGYGPRHPSSVAGNEKLELCRETFGPDGVPAPAPPTPDECAALPVERERLIGEGKGERHPAVLTIDAHMAECRRK